MDGRSIRTGASIPRDAVVTTTVASHETSAGTVLRAMTYVRSPSGEPTRVTREDGRYVELGYDDSLRVTTERYFNVSPRRAPS